MELLTILLSGLLGVLTPVGFFLDRTAESSVRAQFRSVEQLQVRIDNTPSYQVLQGKVDRIRVAGRGLVLPDALRIDTLEFETDPVEVDATSLVQGPPKFNRPLQAGVRLVLRQVDLNQALRSPAITAQLKDITINLPNLQQAQLQRYDFVNPRLEFLDNQRLRLQVDLQEQGYPDRLGITLESGINIVRGQQVQLVEPKILINGEPAPEELVNGLSQGISQQFNLGQLARSGLTVRILKLQLLPSDRVEVALFVRSFGNSPP